MRRVITGSRRPLVLWLNIGGRKPAAHRAAWQRLRPVIRWRLWPNTMPIVWLAAAVAAMTLGILLMWALFWLGVPVTLIGLALMVKWEIER